MTALRCELFPTDVGAAARFYVEVLGFDVERDERTAEASYVALARGGARVGLAQRADVGNVAQRRPPGRAERPAHRAPADPPADAPRRDRPSPGHHPTEIGGQHPCHGRWRAATVER